MNFQAKDLEQEDVYELEQRIERIKNNILIRGNFKIINFGEVKKFEEIMLGSLEILVKEYERVVIGY